REDVSARLRAGVALRGTDHDWGRGGAGLELVGARGGAEDEHGAPLFRVADALEDAVDLHRTPRLRARVRQRERDARHQLVLAVFGDPGVEPARRDGRELAGLREVGRPGAGSRT